MPKYAIEIRLRPSILDNAGKAVTEALKRSLEFPMVENVRIGKLIELECEEKDIDKIAKSIYNEVMEDYIVREIE